MRGLVIVGGILAGSILAESALSAAALPLSEFGRVYPYLVRKAQICLLTSIPTQANRITDAPARRGAKPADRHFCLRPLPLRPCGRCQRCLLPEDLPVKGLRRNFRRRSGQS